MKSAKEDWRPVTRSKPCPVCKRPNHDHQSTWCSVLKDESVVLCHFVADGSFRGGGAQGGWFHRLREVDPNRRYREVIRPKRTEPPARNWNDLMTTFSLAVDNDRLDRLAEGLGVTSESLDLLDIGFIEGTTWAFPMFNSERQPVGIRTRTEEGKKRAIKGTKEGLFIPRRRRDGLLLFTEGPTDCAAMLDLGFDCIGRPSCYGCEEWCAALSRRRKVGIVADNDTSEVGTKGAERLAAAIKKTASDVKIIYSPYLKDARAWKQDGATYESIMICWGVMETWTGK